MWQQIWICSSSKCKFACSTHQAPQRRGTKLPHTMLVIRQKLPKQSKTIARAVVKLAVRNEIFCPFAQLRIPATYFTLKQLIKGWRPSGLLIFWFLRERRGKGLCSEQSRQAFQQCWSVPVAGRANDPSISKCKTGIERKRQIITSANVTIWMCPWRPIVKNAQIVLNNQMSIINKMLELSKYIQNI